MPYNKTTPFVVAVGLGWGGGRVPPGIVPPEILENPKMFWEFFTFYFYLFNFYIHAPATTHH